MENFYIILMGALVACSCGLIGCFLILRKIAMVGDAISHAVLPGIVLAYLISGSREPLPMIIGASVLGILTTIIIELFHKKAKLQEDASIGVTFTWLFAIGVIMVTAFTGKVDLDQECVLYGEIAYVGLGETGVPLPIITMSIVLFTIILLIYFFYKEFQLTTFDPAYASAIGVSVAVWHYILMGMVSLTTVAAFEAVGSILVVAFLVAPAATAYLLTENLKVMLVLSCISGTISSTLGYFIASWLDASIAGSMAAIAGLLFLIALLFSPSQGVIFKKRLFQSVST